MKMGFHKFQFYGYTCLYVKIDKSIVFTIIILLVPSKLPCINEPCIYQNVKTILFTFFIRSIVYLFNTLIS